MIKTAVAATAIPSDTEQYAGLRDRDYFHIMLNLDSFDGFVPVARELAEKFLDAARRRQQDPVLEAELRPFTYTRQAFETRCDETYQGMADDVARYDAAQSWSLRTRDDVVDWILQMAPFNQTDGAWLRTIADVGPMDELHSLLFSIYVDELGGADPALNHANVYTKLLRSVGFELPSIRSRAYVDNAAIVDAAFTLPLFQLVISQFPQDFLPELLGMTLYLEWGSIELKNMVLLNRHFGLDTQFYELHVAIDNAATGHGAMAQRAITLYLEQVRISSGDDAVQDQWRRVWDGYVAFATTGELGAEMAARRARPAIAADKVAAMIATRAAKARLNHGTKRLGDRLLNELFDDPPTLMAALVEHGFVKPGDPEGSPFFRLTTPTGPMYRIFTDAELNTWREWVRALSPKAPAPPAPPRSPAPIAERMRSLIDGLRDRQHGVAAHAAATLTGDDPRSSGQQTTQPVAWWFDLPATALMAALARAESGWVVSGDAESSKLITAIVRGNNAMAHALSAETQDGTTGAQVITEWINARCPLPAAQDAVRPITLLSPPDRVTAHPTGQILGSGSVH
ncbi:iron-containing redox enzyme family protein [Mycobacterium sp. NPDC048908]|uniref:iron-containing redox enzyme family protein n=1 Tax=Mycobacterium sp. NPDC048908 TaxID=3364292 RepID=UPI0037154CC3